MSKVNGQYALPQAQWQQLQKLEANQGTLSGLSSQDAAKAHQLEDQQGTGSGSSLSQQQLQELLALLMKNAQQGQAGQPGASQSLGLHHIA